MHDAKTAVSEKKSSATLRIIVPVLIGLVCLSMTFLGGYFAGVHAERQTSQLRVEELSGEIVNCNRSLEQWCNGKRIRAGSCAGEMHMCICANEDDVKNFEF